MHAFDRRTDGQNSHRYIGTPRLYSMQRGNKTQSTVFDVLSVHRSIITQPTDIVTIYICVICIFWIITVAEQKFTGIGYT